MRFAFLRVTVVLALWLRLVSAVEVVFQENMLLNFRHADFLPLHLLIPVTFLLKSLILLKLQPFFENLLLLLQLLPLRAGKASYGG